MNYFKIALQVLKEATINVIKSISLIVFLLISMLFMAAIIIGALRLITNHPLASTILLILLCAPLKTAMEKMSFRNFIKINSGKFPFQMEKPTERRKGKELPY